MLILTKIRLHFATVCASGTFFTVFLLVFKWQEHVTYDYLGVVINFNLSVFLSYIVRKQESEIEYSQDRPQMLL